MFTLGGFSLDKDVLWMLKKDLQEDKLRKFYSVALLCFLVSCGNQSAQDSTLSQSEIPSTASETARLGQGYNTYKRSLLNTQCAQGVETSNLGNTQADIVISRDQSFSDQLDKLNGRLSVDAWFPAVRAGANAFYSSETAASENVSTYNFDWRIVARKLTLQPFSEGNYRLTTDGQKVANSLRARSLDLCGDEFITEIEYGASLNINLRIEYRNERDKQEIGGRIAVDVLKGTVEVKGELNYLDESVKNSVEIEVRATQKGGNPIELVKIIPDGLMTCTLNNPKPCFDIFQSAVKYVRNELPTQFESLDKYNVIKYKTQSYVDSGILDLQPTTGYPTVNVQVESLRYELDQKFGDALLDKKRAQKLLSTYRRWLNDDQADEIRQIEQWANSNALNYSRAAVYCYDNPFENCIENWEDNFSPLINSYDRNKLSINAKSVSYFARCELARIAAVEFAYIRPRLANAYRNHGWAPVFDDPSRPALGVRIWAPCVQVVKTYGDNFRSHTLLDKPGAWRL